ncbi:MAG TPA: hypothetical protein VF511_06285 [Chthoniobacterales bacterium]
MRCRSAVQFAALGSVPPRSPGRPDAQVPRDLADGPARHARLAHLYFYDEARPTDPAFGFLDLEISLQRIGEGQYQVELYAIGDGYQSGTGFADEPLRITFAQGERAAASVDWLYPQVKTGHLDPMTFRATATIADADFDSVDRVVIPSASAHCEAHIE